MDRPIRVLVANRPKLMRELIIETFVDQPDITVVGEVTEEAQILDRVQETNPDFLIIALADPRERPAICDEVLRMHPEVGVIAVAAHRNETVRYWASFSIHASVMESSEEAILGAIRNNRALARKTLS
jgi:DNA-binding NarL/FixJ family response regulator